MEWLVGSFLVLAVSLIVNRIRRRMRHDDPTAHYQHLAGQLPLIRERPAKSAPSTGLKGQLTLLA